MTSAVAAFDFDGTLTTADCVVPFLRRLAGTRGIAVALAGRPMEAIASVARLDRDRMKELVVGRVYSGRQVDDVDAAGKEFAVDIERTLLRADVLARLRWHQREGHRCVVVSASMRSYLVPLAATLGISDVICTDVVAQDGRYTDRLLGGNCRGSAKVARLQEWMTEHQLGHLPLWAYGDSTGDRYMLDLADHAEWVRGVRVPAVPGSGS